MIDLFRNIREDVSLQVKPKLAQCNPNYQLRQYLGRAIWPNPTKINPNRIKARRWVGS